MLDITQALLEVVVVCDFLALTNGLGVPTSQGLIGCILVMFLEREVVRLRS